MIKINQKFSIYRDKYSWNLVETGALKVNAKTRKESRPTKVTYHGTFDQVAAAVIDRMAGDCDSVKELHELFKTGVSELVKEMNSHNIPTPKAA